MSGGSNLPVLSDQELTFLTLANAGEYLIKCPATIALADRGYMRPADAVNYTITKEGREVLEAVAESEARGQEKAFRGVQNKHVEIQLKVKHAATMLAEACRESADITGDSPEQALENWLRALRDYATEALRPR